MGLFLEYGFLEKSLIFRLRGGYASVSYEVFDTNDKLPIRISAFEFGDDRNTLTPKMSGNFFAKAQLVYRFNL